MKKKSLLIIIILIYLLISLSTSFCDKEASFEESSITEGDFKNILIKFNPFENIDISILEINENDTLTVERAAYISTTILKVMGEKDYPVISSFYEENLSDILESQNNYKEDIIFSFYKGILSLDNSGRISPKKGINYQDGLSIANRIFFPEKRLSGELIVEGYKDKIGFKVKRPSRKEFFSGDILKYTVEVENKSKLEESIWIGFTLIDPMGKNYDIKAVSVKIPENEKITVAMSFKVPAGIISGRYRAITAIWSDSPSNLGAKRIGNWESGREVYIYNKLEEFSSLDRRLWKSTDGKLGRSSLLSKNVYEKDGYLNIEIPAKTLNGGEISSVRNLSYGSYEINMKVPDAESSITGFFLYKSPDYYNEIDIEVVNDSSGEFWLTTYSDGKKNNSFIGNLGINFTDDFHTFRFEYYPESLSFYIDDRFIEEFTEGYTERPMKLMVNSWFPSWMNGIKGESSKSLLIDYIKY